MKSVDFKRMPIHDFMINMVRINGLAYRYFAKNSFPGLLEEAVKQNPKAIKFAPKSTQEWQVEFASPVGVWHKKTVRFYADNVNDLLSGIQKKTRINILDVRKVVHSGFLKGPDNEKALAHHKRPTFGA